MSLAHSLDALGGGFDNSPNLEEGAGFEPALSVLGRWFASLRDTFSG
jgi:hypothetical protein